MSTLIKPLTPLWRPAPTFQCGARCEPIRGIIGQDFEVLMPPNPGVASTYQLAIDESDVWYTLDASEFIPTDEGVFLNFRSEDGNVSFTAANLSGDTITRNARNQCITLSLVVYTVLGLEIIVQDTGEKFTLTWVDNTCGEYSRIAYQLDCNSPTYTYVLKGGIRRIAPVLSDEVNYTDPTGRNKRVFTRTENQARIYSMPFGWQEHDFLRAILDRDRFQINGIPVQLQEGAAWQPTQADTAYMVGGVDVVTDANISGLCCTEESSL
jgi:hypothetical protein